jgi:hypothetical protein
VFHRKRKARNERRKKMVCASYNAEQWTLDGLVGMTVLNARLDLGAVMGVPRHAKCRVNGNWVSGDYRLCRGDDLEFVVLWGRKGGKRRKSLSLTGSQDATRFIVPEGSPDWVTTDKIEDTIRVWQRYYREPLTAMDAVEILMNTRKLLEQIVRGQEG